MNLKLYAKSCIALTTSVLFSISFSNVSAQISTIAGTYGYLGDGGNVANAGLFGPYAIAIDASGNIYIATASDNRVRKVDGTTHNITTIAGTGIAGYSGDNGPATSAELDFNPSGLPGIAVDASGNVYIGDYFNSRVRKVNTSGVITTIAGTGVEGYTGDGSAAAGAEINGPAGIAVDAAGDVYFADNNNSVIREINATTKKISTVAGNYLDQGEFSGDGNLATSAGLNYPERIALDASGDLFISDGQNYVVREVNATTKDISTVAGQGQQEGFSGDGSLATSATLSQIVGIAVDNSGNLYIADENNNRVREVYASNKKIATIAGGNAKGYTGDGGLAVDAELAKPCDVLLDKSGNLYIDDYGNNVIRMITASTSDISTAIGDGTNGGFSGVPTALQAQLAPQDVTFDPSGNMYIADGYYYDVRAVNIASSSYIYAGAPNPDPAYASKGFSGNGSYAVAAKLNAPFSVVADASNNLYIADVFNNQIRKVTYTTAFISAFAGSTTPGSIGDGSAATSAELNTPYGLAIDKNNNIYIADAGNNKIRMVNASTLKISTVAGNGTPGSSGDNGAATSAELNYPYAVAVDGNLNIFIIDKGNNKVRKVTAGTQDISTIFTNGDVLKGIAVDAAGDIYVSDSTASTIIRLDKTNYGSQVVAGDGTAGYSGDGGAAKSAQLNNPGGLYIDASGYIYVADINNHVIRKVIMGALAVLFENFTAEAQHDQALLNWTTASEENTDHFDIERSADGITWGSIGTVPAHGNSTTPESYTYTDAAPILQTTDYYRLKEVDLNGASTFSQVRLVEFAGAFSVKVYPNPATDYVSMDFYNSKNETGSIVVNDASGNRVVTKQQSITQGSNHISVSEIQTLPAGIYFITLRTSTHTYHTKIVKANN